MNQSLKSFLPQPSLATQFWWIRHARVPEVAHRMYGSLDVNCDTSDTSLFSQVAAKLPAEAIWFTTPLRRTHQTAQALFEQGVSASEHHVDNRIVEQDFGDYNGLTHEELFAKRTDAYLGFWPISPSQQAPNGESFMMLRQRVEQFVDEMVSNHVGQNIVCVAHRGSILAALQIALDLPLHNSVSFSIGNVSVTRLTYHSDVPKGGPRWRVVDVSWLP